MKLQSVIKGVLSFCLVLLGMGQLQAVSYNYVPASSSKQFGVGYASHFKISSSEEAFVIGVCGLTWSDFPTRSYDGYRAFVDSRIVDREKRSGKTAKDHQWCVQYSYVDLLTFSGWGKKAGYSTEDALGDAVLSAGDDPLSFVEWRADDLTPYLKSCPQGSSFLQKMDDLLDKANGWLATAIYYDNYTWYDKYFSSISHGVAICGFSYNPSRAVTDPTALKGLFVVESDNDRENGSGGSSAPDTITYCPVSWNGSRYQVSNVFGTTGYLNPQEDGLILYSETTPSVVTVSTEDATPVQYRVMFGKNGGTGGDNYVTATYGKAMPAPRTAPKKEGWSFGGYWDTLAMDANGNPKGKQYYNAKMQSVRNWDKTSTATLWAKWTVRVKLGKNGGTGGDDYVTVVYGQPFPARKMPTKSGCKFGGYWVSAGKLTGLCYHANGTRIESMKWKTGGTPTIWALWLGSNDIFDVYSVGKDAESYYSWYTASQSLSYGSFSSYASWLKNIYTYSFTNGQGEWELDVYYSVNANTSTSARSAGISGKVGSQKIVIVVNQAGK